MSEPTRNELIAQLAAMQRQMAQLQQQLNAQQSGSGALAQGPQAKAAGAGGLVADTIQGNVYLGAPPEDSRAALAIYHRVYVATYRYLSLRGIHISTTGQAEQMRPLDLTQVYITLDTRTRVRKAARCAGQLARRKQSDQALSLLAAAIAHPQLVIVGAPGSGKSTFLNYLGLCLALHQLEPDGDWLAHLPGWPASAADLLPIAVTLRDFAHTLPDDLPPATPQQLWAFITTRLQAQNLDFAVDLLEDALEQGNALVLFDGLDEIVTTAQRAFVRDCVAAFAARYPSCRLLVNCRTFAYHTAESSLTDFPFVEIAPFTDAQLATFITAWYAELTRTNHLGFAEAATLSLQLREAIQHPELRRLAATPRLLTVMTLVHTYRGHLPDARALLYEETIDILLSRWDTFKQASTVTVPTVRHLLAEAERTEVDLKRVLWRLAYVTHGQIGNRGNADALADISELDLQNAFASLHPTQSRDWAYALLQAIQLRAGLLIERLPGVYTFPHRTFQEYLAGAHLAAQGDFAQLATALAQTGPFWRQVILLAVGRLVYLSGDLDKPLALVGELAPQRPPPNDPAWHQCWLAGAVLLEIRLHRVAERALGRDLLDRVQNQLVALLRVGALKVQERVATGDVLARLGDPRFNPEVWFLPTEPRLGFIEIPAGPFQMGRNPSSEPNTQPWEQPQSELTLPTYYIARYPVTVAQFRAFCTATGYAPEDTDALRDLPTHPVRWITWYEAIHYCAWLTATLRTWAATPEPLATCLRTGLAGSPPWSISLPSEAEWEKAARGPADRLYPWGNTPAPTLANYAATRLNTTSPVGCFPAGASAYGVEELAGNVWEWTRSLWGNEYKKPAFGYPYTLDPNREGLAASENVLRVLRGGAYYSSATAINCGFRFRHYPRDRNGSLGFRVVASPFSTPDH